MRTIQLFIRAVTCLAVALAGFAVHAQGAQGDYRLGAGDAIRIQVFQNPDLTLESRVSESGTITYPLIGTVQIGGLTISGAEQKIATGLKSGGFVQQPQVNIVLIQNRGNQVSVLGQVNRPGRYPLETFTTRVSEMLATAGGTTANGDEVVIVSGFRDGKAFRKRIDIPALFIGDGSEADMTLIGGDTIFVDRAPVFYVYGEVQRPGSYRIERNMTVQQALAQGGGPTIRGTENRLRLHRRGGDASTSELSPALVDPIQPNDVLYVRESLF